MKRKIIQIATIPESGGRLEQLFGLCDDGTVWQISADPLNDDVKWRCFPKIPQGDEKKFLNTDNYIA